MWPKKINDLQVQNKAILELAKSENRSVTDDEQEKFDNNLGEIEKAQKMIDNEAKLAGIDNLMVTPVNANTPIIGGNSPEKPAKQIYRNFSEQMIDVKNAAQTGFVSQKLQEFTNVAAGLNEGVGSEGGFLVQSDFAGMLLESAVKDDGILNRVDEYEVSGNSNSVEWTDIDESDISTTVFGGIQTYWAAEAATVTKSNPTFKKGRLELEKLMGLCYITYELDADSSFLDSLLTKGFTTSIRRNLTGAVVSGDGIGKPTGFLNGGGLVTIAKESGQTAGTIVWENITKMYNQAFEPKSGGWAWVCHPDCLDQLDNMDRVVGTGGVPVYQPASMTGAQDTLRGLPILTSDHCSALGTAGDFNLVDLSDYFLPFKGQIQKDMSIHVQFLTAENAFRFIFRVNGRPKTLNQLTIKNSTKKRGKYLTIATRA